uniref:Uncharacterized protein n=1 Tax=Cacopsylla melanoneura TaxID=428564 RepID=A0A8D8TTG5_9HEMI
MLSLQNFSTFENMTLTDDKYRKEIKLLKEEITYERTKPELERLATKIQTALFELNEKLNNCFKRKEIHLARQYIVAMEYYRILNIRLRESAKLLDQENFGVNLDTW